MLYLYPVHCCVHQCTGACVFVVQWLHPPQILHCTSDDLVHMFGTTSINITKHVWNLALFPGPAQLSVASSTEPTTLKVCTLKHLHLHCCRICESFVSWGKEVESSTKSCPGRVVSSILADCCSASLLSLLDSWLTCHLSTCVTAERKTGHLIKLQCQTVHLHPCYLYQCTHYCPLLVAELQWWCILRWTIL